MSYLLFDHQDSGRSLYINGRGYNSPGLMNRLPVTSIDQGIPSKQQLYLENVRGNPAVGILFRIPHASIFLLQTSSFEEELFIAKMPDSHKKLPDVFGAPAKKGIVVWADENPEIVTIFDSEGVHALTQQSHIYSRADISITFE